MAVKIKAVAIQIQKPILVDQFTSVMKDVQACFYERDEEIEAVLLAILARQHIFCLGEPGVAKSMMLEYWASRFTGATYFRSLAHKFSAPEQFLGPYKLSALKADSYQRQINGYLPTAQIAFIDEVYKANGGVLNTFLSMMVERVFEMDGKIIPVPLITMMGASNEIYQEDDLRALHDRFLVRRYVERVRDPANLVKLLNKPTKQPTLTLAMQDLVEAHRQVDLVDVPDAVAQAAIELHEALMEKQIKTSDRRLKQAMSLVRAHAWLNGRPEANVGDLVVLKDVFWTKFEEIRIVSDLVTDKVNPMGKKAKEAYERVVQAIKGLEKITNAPDKLVQFTELLPSLNKEVADLKAFSNQAKKEGHDVTQIIEVREKVKKLRDDLCDKYLPKAPVDDEEEA